MIVIDRVKACICKRKDANVIETMLLFLMSMVLLCAFLVIVLGAFSSIDHKWAMRQTAREYLLIMETEGYLNSADQVTLIEELESHGLYNISLTGTTTSQVNYGDRIYLCITGTYDDNVLAFADGISRVAAHPVQITIHRQTTAKQ